MATNTLNFIIESVSTLKHLSAGRIFPELQRPRLMVSLFFLSGLIIINTARGEPIRHITVDGNFDDWANVPSYTDPLGTELHNGIPDVHDTDHHQAGDVPSFVNHPDVDLREYKFTHDENNLYAYFRATGQIGATRTEAAGGAGRYYVIVTIDVDNNLDTGYWLHEGGYFPSSDGYDMNMEAEFYNGSLNTAHYLSHDAADVNELQQDFYDLTSQAFLPDINVPRDRIDDSEISSNAGPYTPGTVEPGDGTYDDYTQWVYHDDDTLTLVVDKGPIVPGIMSVAVSADGHELEIAAPFKGFLGDMLDNPNIALGNVINISFSLEASGELWRGGWASDTGDPILGYVLGEQAIPEPGSLLLAVLAGMGVGLFRTTILRNPLQ